MTNLTNIKANQANNPLTQKSRFGWVPVLVVATLLINSFLSFRLLRLTSSSVTSRPYIYVQKPDGTTDLASSANNLHRTEAVVAAFAEDWLKLAYTWRSSKPNSYIKEGNIKYPMPLHMASHSIVPGYREAYLVATNQRYSNQLNFQQYLSGKHQSIVRVFDQPIVEQVEPGIWDVTVIATRTHSQGNSVVAQEKFNHRLRLKAIDPGNNRLDSQNISSFEKLLKKTQLQGLQIIKISQY